MDAAGRAGERSEAGKFSSVSGNRRPAIHVGNKERVQRNTTRIGESFESPKKSSNSGGEG